MIENSDVVVKGAVIDVEAGADETSGVLVVSPEEALKGSIPSGPARITFQHVSRYRADELIGKTALAFAELDPRSGELSLVPTATSSNQAGLRLSLRRELLTLNPASNPGPFVPVRSGDTPTQKIIKEVAHMQRGMPSSERKFPLISYGLVRSRPDTYRELFQAMMRDGTSRDYGEAVWGFVLMGKVEGLEVLDAALAEGRPQLENALSNLILYDDPDPRGVEILARWMDARSPPQLRAAAAAALSKIHTPEAVMVLGPALYDSDFQIRWRAIGALGMFANNFPIGGVGPGPGPAPFLTEDTIRFSINSEDVKDKESQYLAFWKSWWAENREAVEKMTTKATR